MNDLRERLREVTLNGMPDTHPDLIEQLRHVFAHSIEIVPSPTPINRYTCAMYAFDLVEDEEYKTIVLASPAPVYASTGFVQRLIDHGTLRRLDEPQADHLVVYRLDHAVTHIGRTLTRERVESKWGIGHLYRHALFEVPSQYGDECEFYATIDANVALDELATFARDHGVQFEGDD